MKEQAKGGTNERVPAAPRGWMMLAWIGPGIIWMISAIATGELLFTPRIASLYGYTVLWAMFIAIFLKVMLAREIGRYAVVTGGSLLHGIRRIPGPAAWAVWFLLVPQFVVAVATITGMAGATGSAVILAFGGDFRWWAGVFLGVSALLVLLGRYRGVERVSLVMSFAITAALVIAAAIVFPGLAPVARGFRPVLPPDVNFSELLPWLGFMMSGAAGLVWYSYWLVARGYGMAYHRRTEDAEPVKLDDVDGAEGARLRGWIRSMTGATIAAGAIVLVLLTALLVLGTELLRPAGLVPEGPAVTAVLSRLLGDVWGGWGAALMILAAFFAFWSTIVANLDGWARMLGQGTIFLGRRLGWPGWAVSPDFYRWLYIVALMGVLPASLVALFPEPVRFLIVAGIIEAVQIPFLALAVLYLNLRHLPAALRPSLSIILVLAVTGVFFLGFAGFYLYTELFR